jgi:hypothetical protein
MQINNYKCITQCIYRAKCFTRVFHDSVSERKPGICLENLNEHSMRTLKVQQHIE